MYNRDLKTFSDKELATRIVGYIDEINSLISAISDYINAEATPYKKYAISERYKSIKTQVKEDAKNVSLCINADGSELYKRYFKPSVTEASAYGFLVATNAKIDYKMVDALAEAKYRLRKFYGYDEWKHIAEQ